MNKNQIEDLKTKIDTIKTQWGITLEKYYEAYADKKTKENDSNSGVVSAFGGERQNLLTLFAEVEKIESTISGLITTNSRQIKKKTNQIKNMRLNSENSIANMEKDIEKNKTGVTLKTDKIDEKSRAYLSTSFYTISLITMTFFIYKQLKQ